MKDDFSLNNEMDTITLMCIAANAWVEIARASNGD